MTMFSKMYVLLIGFFMITILSCGQNQPQPKTKLTEQKNDTLDTIPLKVQASSSGLYVVEDNKVFFISITLTGHDLKIGDEIDAVNKPGKRVSFKISDIKTDNDSKVLKNGQYGMLTFDLLSGNVFDIGGDFYLVDKGESYPKE